MFNKIFCLLAAAGLVWSALAAVPVLAQEPPADDSTGVNVKDTVKSRLDRLQAQRQEIENKIKERRAGSTVKAEERKEKVAEVRRKLDAARAERVRASIRRMLTRFEAALGRLDNLAIRIAARLDKLSQDGKNVSASRTALETAQAKIEAAKIKLAEAGAVLETVADSEKPKEDFENSRTNLETVKTAVKEAHTALVDTINSIKGASKK